MRPVDLARLIALAAIWGGSFLFIRMIVPVLGAAWLTELRTAIAAVALLLYVRILGLDLQVRRNLRTYIVMGVLSVVLPWVMFAYAGHYITAGYLAILNASTPWFGAVCGAIWLGEPLTRGKVLGLALGVAGVALMVSLGPIDATPDVIFSAGLCFAAAACYALSGTYMKKRAPTMPAFSLSAGSLLTSSVMLIPFLPAFPPLAVFTWKISIAVLSISLACSAAAFLIYFRLMADIGPTRTLTVTFLIPLFGVLWGIIFLDEELHMVMVAGGAFVLAGTALVVRTGSRPLAGKENT